MWKKMEICKKCIPYFRRTWYNIVRYYTSADLRPTRGRTISLANHAHPPEGIMSEGHVIISTDIITAQYPNTIIRRKEEYYDREDQ